MKGSSSSRREEDDNNKKKPWSWSENKVFESLEDVIEHLCLLINDASRIERSLTELPDDDSDSHPQQHKRLRIGDATDEKTQQSQEMKQEESTGNAVVQGTTQQSQEVQQEGTNNVEEADAERTN